jgi:TPP-dependent pyruvate/acetoin dehydrogenase alpha subunit
MVRNLTGVAPASEEHTPTVVGTVRLETFYRDLWRIRIFEERTTDLFKKGVIKGTAHSCLGQEAIAVGACAALLEEDTIVTHHRGHGHCIAKGADTTRMMAELMGRDTGYGRGLGGSMHIAALDRGILGANGIVGAGLGIGTGAALSAKIRGSGQVCLIFFGDGAANEGLFHEALNLCALWSFRRYLSARITNTAFHWRLGQPLRSHSFRAVP